MSNKKAEMSYCHNENEIVWDEFGRTDAPNWIIDDFRYFTDSTHYKSIFKRLHSLYQKENIIYQNKEVQRRNSETRRRLIIMNEVLKIDTNNLLKCPFYIKYRRHLRNLTINRLKYITHYFFAWQNTPNRATSSDWKKISRSVKNEKYIESLFKILNI